MSEFKQDFKVLTRKFSKRTIHSGDQFYDLKVEKVNEDISIDISSSQLTRGHISGDKDVIEKIIADLQEIIKL